MIEPGQVYTRPGDDGMVRVDDVKHGWVYFARFMPGKEEGRLMRQQVGLFAISLEHSGLTLREEL